MHSWLRGSVFQGPKRQIAVQVSTLPLPVLFSQSCLMLYQLDFRIKNRSWHISIWSQYLSVDVRTDHPLQLKLNFKFISTRIRLQYVNHYNNIVIFIWCQNILTFFSMNTVSVSLGSLFYLSFVLGKPYNVRLYFRDKWKVRFKHHEFMIMYWIPTMKL